VVEFESGYSFNFRDLLIDPFPITHDASDPVGFLLEGGREGLASPLTWDRDRARPEKLRGCEGWCWKPIMTRRC